LKKKKELIIGVYVTNYWIKNKRKMVFLCKFHHTKHLRKRSFYPPFSPKKKKRKACSALTNLFKFFTFSLVFSLSFYHFHCFFEYTILHTKKNTTFNWNHPHLLSPLTNKIKNKIYERNINKNKKKYLKTK